MLKYIGSTFVFFMGIMLAGCTTYGTEAAYPVEVTTYPAATYYESGYYPNNYYQNSVDYYPISYTY